MFEFLLWWWCWTTLTYYIYNWNLSEEMKMVIKKGKRPNEKPYRPESICYKDSPEKYKDKRELFVLHSRCFWCLAWWYAYKHSTWKAEAGDLQVQGQPGLYIEACFKSKIKRKRERMERSFCTFQLIRLWYDTLIKVYHKHILCKYLLNVLLSWESEKRNTD